MKKSKSVLSLALLVSGMFVSSQMLACGGCYTTGYCDTCYKTTCPSKYKTHTHKYKTHYTNYGYNYKYHTCYNCGYSNCNSCGYTTNCPTCGGNYTYHGYVYDGYRY